MRCQSSTGTNLPKMGEYNLRVVFDQIRRARQGVSRVQISQASGLSAQTVSNLVTKLLDLGWVVEGERIQQSRGKPRTMLITRPEAAYVLGTHLDPASTSSVLMDMSGEIVYSVKNPTPGSVDEVVSLIQIQSSELSAGVSEKILGIGLAVPGPVDRVKGLMVSPPNLEGWGTVPLKELVQAVTGLPAFLQKDSIAALSAELWRRNRGVLGTTLFVYLGFGVGFSFSKEGELFVGFSGNAGEIGHLSVDADVPKCSCGKAGCLGEALSYVSIVENAREQGLLLGKFDLNLAADLSRGMDEISHLADNGNEIAQHLLISRSRWLARGIVTIVDFLDASDVVVGGPNWIRLGKYLEEEVQKEFKRVSAVGGLHSVTVHDADYGELVGAAGAGSLVLNDTFSAHPEVLTGQ